MSMRLRIVDADGRRVAILDAEPPDDAPPEVREGFARRALVNGGGRCPCGATWVMPSRAARRAAAGRHQPARVLIRHEPDCPAADEQLLAAIHRWKETR